MPCIAHATKIWTVFDASSIANILHLLDGFLTPPFAIRQNNKNEQQYKCVCDIRLTIRSDELFAMIEVNTNDSA